MSSINTTITSSTISVDNITSENESIEVENPLLCSAIANSTITLTAPTVNIAGEIKNNNSSYTNDLISSFHSNTLTLLEEDLSWTVGGTPSSTNFSSLPSAIEQAMKYYSDGRYTITIDVLDITASSTQIKLLNVDASHIKITGTITLSATPPIYDGYYPVFVFVNCKCPTIDMYIYSGAYSSFEIYVENSTITIGNPNYLSIVSYSSNVEITSNIERLRAYNSTIFAKDITINHSVFAILNNSSLYLEGCVFENNNNDISILHSEANFVDCTILAYGYYISYSTVRFSGGDVECGYIEIGHSIVNMNLINLTTNTTAVAIFAGQGTILNLAVSTLYTATDCNHLLASGANVKLSGLGSIYKNLTKAIIAEKGSIITLYDTIPDTTNITVNTLTSDGLIIG